MIVLASIAIIALVSGTIGAAIGRQPAALKALGGPLLALTIVVGTGRALAGFHLPLMGGIVLWIALGAHGRLRGGYKICGLIAALGLAGATVAGLLLF